MQDESEHLDILFAEMSALECTHQGSTEVDERASWNQYVRPSNETDGTKLKDQLLHCPGDTLSNALDKALGDRVDTISLADL